jgi:hypothetical protein
MPGRRTRLPWRFRADLERFVFLVGSSNGEQLSGHDHDPRASRAYAGPYEAFTSFILRGCAAGAQLTLAQAPRLLAQAGENPRQAPLLDDRPVQNV